MKSPLAAINVFAGFLAGLLGGMLILVASHPIVSVFQVPNALAYPSSGADVIATANTYIVFTTLIFVLFTIILTGTAAWFAKWFGLSKEKEIKENMRDFFDQLDQDSQVANSFTRELFKNKVVYDKVHALIQDRVNREINERLDDEGRVIDLGEISDSLDKES